jgi:hypothetical protein
MFTFGGGFNPSSLQTLSSGVAQALQRINVQIQTLWSKQHTIDGSHTDVTATSLVLAGLFKANGRLNLGNPVRIVRPLEAETQPYYLGSATSRRLGGQADANASFICITTSSLDPSPLIWHGLDAAGREEGDAVFILNDGNQVVEFIADSAAAPLNTRFAGNSTSPSTNIELHTASLGIAVYSHNTFLGSRYWHLLVLM